MNNVNDENIWMACLNFFVLRKLEQLDYIDNKKFVEQVNVMLNALAMDARYFDDDIKGIKEDSFEITKNLMDKEQYDNLGYDALTSILFYKLDYLKEFNVDGTRKSFLQRKFNSDYLWWNKRKQKQREKYSPKRIERVQAYVERYILLKNALNQIQTSIDDINKGRELTDKFLKKFQDSYYKD
jgi:hypothetical protein